MLVINASANEPERVKAVDADGSIDEVRTRIRQLLANLFLVFVSLVSDAFMTQREHTLLRTPIHFLRRSRGISPQVQICLRATS